MAINNDLLAIVSYIERERGVDREIVLGAIEDAIKQSAIRNPSVTNDIRIAIDRKTLLIHVYDTVVVSSEETGTGFISLNRARRLRGDGIREGDTIELEIPPARLGRIVAQTSRQVIMQKIREAERTNTFKDFKSRKHEIVSGTVTAINRRDVFVMVGKTEMLLPNKECIPNENYAVGDTLRAVIKDVRELKEGAMSPSVILSRASAEFVRTLFRLEVAEIADGVVEIMGVARDAGFRAKIAVRTLDEKVDPVGACVGLKGARVRNIVQELNGEKIDIVRWNADPRLYVAQALAPAKLDTIEVDPERNEINVTVPPDQFSLALGKRGQNVHLTRKLMGWTVKVTKALRLSSFEDQRAAAIKTMCDTFSITKTVATKLADSGFLTVDGILEDDEEEFIAMSGLDEVEARGIYAAAQAVAELTADNVK